MFAPITPKRPTTRRFSLRRVWRQSSIRPETLLHPVSATKKWRRKKFGVRIA